MALIKKRLDIEAVLTPGKTGQFEVIADGERIAERGGNWFTRGFGAGYPDLDSVVEQLENARSRANALQLSSHRGERAPTSPSQIGKGEC